MEAVWAEAIPYGRFLEEAEKNRGLWEGVYRTAKIPDWALEKACEKTSAVRLLVIAEDWCGDAANTVPVLARLGDEAECLEMRILKRDEYPEIMGQYLTNGSRSIPIVIALDESGRELGHWGPRPGELQTWVMEHKETMPRSELYPETRKWYARDRGITTLTEVLSLFD